MNTKLQLMIKWLGMIFALSISAFWALYAMRFTGLAFFVILLISIVFLPIHKKWRTVIISWALFLIVTLIPIDVRFDKNPEINPRVLPILWGLPSEQGQALIDRGDVFAGGDLVTSWVPKWALVI